MLDLDKAVPDFEDPEILVVPHMKMGRRVILHCDLSNLIDSKGEKIDLREFNISSTVVDE